MNILEFDHQEFEEALETAKDNIKESKEDIGDLMASSLESLLFLGNNIKDNQDLLNVAIFNIRLCYVYFMSVEDYMKLDKITKLIKDIEVSTVSIVDNKIIDDIIINLN
jgi:hypothetical protein